MARMAVTSCGAATAATASTPDPAMIWRTVTEIQSMVRTRYPKRMMGIMSSEVLGMMSCGAVEDMTTCLDGVDLAHTSCAMNDPSPFTLLAFMLATARRHGVDWHSISGTSNQSDYLSHFVANHMFFRLALPGARRILTDHIAWCGEHVPRWNALSVVGQVRSARRPPEFVIAKSVE